MFATLYAASLALAIVATALYMRRAWLTLRNPQYRHPWGLPRPIVGCAAIGTAVMIFAVVAGVGGFVASSVSHSSRPPSVTKRGVSALLSNLIVTCQWANGDECAPLRTDPRVLQCVAASSNVWSLDSCPSLATFAKSGIATLRAIYDTEKDSNTGESSRRIVATSWTIAPGYKQYLADSPEPSLLVVTGMPHVDRASISHESPTALLVKWTVDFVPTPIARYDIGGNANALLGPHSYYSEFRWNGAQWRYVAPFVPGQQLADRYAWANETFFERLQNVAAGLFMIALLPFAALLYLLSQRNAESWKGPRIRTGFHGEK